MKKQIGELKVDRFLVPYRVYGEGSHTIFCLSGAKQTMTAWRPVVSYFGKSARIVVFDMPGQGRGQILHGHPGIDLEEQVMVLDMLMSEVMPEKQATDFVSLVGGSWGSIVAATYGARYPERVDSLILGSFGTKANMVLQSVIEQVKELVTTGRGREIAPIMIEKFGSYIPDRLKKRIVEQFDAMSDDQYQAFYEHAVFVTEMEDLCQHVSLENITAPTMVIMGQYDTIMDLFDTKKATKLIPNGEYHVVKGVGHFLHLERESVLDDYAEFFDRVLSKHRAMTA